jgi:hypothetical protein
MKIINIFFFSFVLLLTGCGGSGDKVSLSKLEISTNTQLLDYQETTQLSVLAINSDDSLESLISGVTFSSTNNDILSISNTGLITAISEGEASVTASYQGKESSISIDVTYSIINSEIRIDPEPDNMIEGTNYQSNLWVIKTDGLSYLINEDVLWLSSDETLAEISSEGLLALLNSGDVYIEATFGDINIQRLVSIQAKEISEIAIELSPAQVALGYQSNAIVTVIYNNGSSENLTTSATLSSGDSSVATINEDGVVSSLAVGVTVLNAEFSGFTSSVNFEVTDAVITQLLFNIVQNSMPVGMTPLYVVKQQFSDGSLIDITLEHQIYTLSSEDLNFASIDNYVITTVSPGSVDLTVTAGNLQTSTLLTISEAVVTDIALSTNTLSLALGLSGEVSTTATLSSGSQISIDPVYSSSDQTVLIVNQTGLITASGIGQAIVTAQYNNIQDTITIDVNPAALASLNVSFEILTLPIGRKTQANATGNFTDGTSSNITQDVSWSSSTPNLLSVSNTVKGEVTAIIGSSIDVSSPVTVLVTASLNGIENNAGLDVVSAVVDALSVDAGSSLASLGNQLELTATATYSNLEDIDVSNDAIWLSSDETVATVSSNGLLSTIAEGVISVSATFDGYVQSFEVTVGPATLDSVTISTTSLSIYKGRVKQLNAIGTMSDGSEITVTKLGFWSVDNSNLATVSNDSGSEGVFTAIEDGNVNITFTPHEQSLPPTGIFQSIKPISEMTNEFSKSVSSSMSVINGVVQNGSKISLTITNNTGETVSLLKFKVDDANGEKISTSDASLLSDGSLTSGESVGLTYTVNYLGATKPITLTYEVEDPVTNETFNVSSTIN